MTVSFSITKITTRRLQEILLPKSSIVLLVGPNNSGKSTFLRELSDIIHGSPRVQVSKVVSACEFEYSGAEAEYEEWISKNYRKIDTGNIPQLIGLGGTFHARQIEEFWQNRSMLPAAILAQIAYRSSEGSKQVNASSDESMFTNDRSDCRTLAQLMYHDLSFEKKVSDTFRKAFGTGLFVYRCAGNQIPIFLGDPPSLKKEENYQDSSYWERILLANSRLREQGDGMKSFAGALFNATADPLLMVSYDEPDLYLHPPQAYVFGKFLSEETENHKQFFIATHNSSFVRGVLDGDHGRGRVVVLRIRREQDGSYIDQLNSQTIKSFWSDPLLRFSNAIDGLFHSKIVLCESDTDSRFYSAMLSVVAKSQERQEPDFLFIPAWSKDRVKILLKAFKSLNVPVSIIFDMDFLNNQSLVKEVVELQNAPFSNFKALHSQLENDVRNKRDQRCVGDLKIDIERIFANHVDSVVSNQLRTELQAVLKQKSGWEEVKKNGLRFFEGAGYQNAQNYLVRLEEADIYVVPVGELEQFYKPASSLHGPAWLNKVIEQNFLADPELGQARDFVGKLLQPKSSLTR